MVPNGGTTARGRSSSEVANRSWSWILPGRTENPTRIRCRSKGVSVATSRAPRAMRVRAAAGVRSFLKRNPAIRIVAAGWLVGETAEIPERSGFLCAGILKPRDHSWFPARTARTARTAPTALTARTARTARTAEPAVRGIGCPGPVVGLVLECDGIGAGTTVWEDQCENIDEPGIGDG